MALHEVLLELAFVLSVLPFVVTSSFLFGEVVVALEEVTVVVEDFTWTFDVCLVPVCLNLRPVWEGDDPEAIFLAIDETALVKGAVGVVILPFAILFALAPHAVIDISIGVFHLPLTVLHIIPPLTFIDIPVCIAVPSVALLAVLHYSFITLSVPEEIVPIDQRIVLPGSEVDVSVVVDVDAEVVALAVGV